MVILNWGHAKRLFRAVTISDIGFKTDRMPIGSFGEGFRHFRPLLLIYAIYSGAIFMAASAELPIKRTFPVIQLSCLDVG
jgi:hypothetical protein